VQLLARLQAERLLRPIALLHPRGLELSAPRRRLRSLPGIRPTIELRDAAFETAVREALAITGARTIHLEGTAGVPLGSVLRLGETGVQVVLSVSDFSLFCARPHLLEIRRQANGGAHFRATIKHINSAGPLVKIEALAEWGAPVHVEMSQEKFHDLQLLKNEAVFIIPKEIKAFQNKAVS